MPYLSSLLRGFFDFSSRTSRKDYWMTMLWLFIVMIIIVLPQIVTQVEYAKAARLMGGYRNYKLVDFLSANHQLAWFYVVSGIVQFVSNLVLFIPVWAMHVRRLHDINRTGWWVIVPFMNFIWTFYKGDEGHNCYGPGSSSSRYSWV